MTAFGRVNFLVRHGDPAVLWIVYGGCKEAIALHPHLSGLRTRGVQTLMAMADAGHRVFETEDPAERTRRLKVLVRRCEAAISAAEQQTPSLT